MLVESVKGFSVMYHQFIAMYDRGCQICCNYTDAGVQLMVAKRIRQVGAI